MKILITNHHLQEYTGTEVSTLTLAKYLKKYGNEIIIYSKFTLDKITNNFSNIGIKVVKEIDEIKNEKFDIAHIHHNICAYEIRYNFPKLPIVMWIHGTIPFLEQPPIIDLNISKFLVNNYEIYNHLLKLGISKKKIIISRNLIDPEIFYKIQNINKVPQKALIISNKITKEKEEILINSLKELKIEYEIIGSRFKIIPNNNLGEYINKADIVFSLGLGIMESMFCGRVPIIFDYAYDDGIVSPSNFEKLMKYNFSGRANKKIFNKQDLIKEIKKYNYNWGDQLLKKSNSYYNANKRIKDLIKIYEKSINEFRYKKIDKTFLEHIYKLIKISRHYTYINNKYYFDKNLQNIEDKLNKIEKSKIFKLLSNFLNLN